MTKPVTIIMILASLFPAFIYPQENKTSGLKTALHGYLSDLQGLTFTPRPDTFISFNQLHNRLNLYIQFSPRLSGRFELRTRLIYGDPLRNNPEFGRQIKRYNGLIDLSLIWSGKQPILLHTVADRFLLRYSKDNWDITAGRQRINWGVNTIWNPNDIFNAWNFLDFDYAERPGNDAIRIQHSLAGNSSWEIAFKPGLHRNEFTGAFMYKFNKWKYDFQYLGGIWQADLVVGAGWAGSIAKAGFKGEVSYFHPRKKITDTTGILSFSLMTDKTFTKDWYLALSFLYNSNRIEITRSQPGFFSTSLNAKNLFPYQYTFYTSATKTFSPVSSLTTTIIYSPDKNTLILYPSWTRNLAENVDFDLTLQAYAGKVLSVYKLNGISLFIRGKFNF